MRRFVVAFAMLAAGVPTLAIAQERPRPTAPSTYWEEGDESGASDVFRVAFDPGSDIEIGAAIATAIGGEREAAALPQAVFSVAYRAWLVFGEGDGRVSWQLDHAFIRGHVDLAQFGELPAGEVTLYRGEFLRHDELPHATLPGDPPRRVPFPFDIGLETEALRVRSEPHRFLDALRLGVASAAATLDPWRTGRQGDSFELGWGAWYDLDIDLASADEPVVSAHRVAPLTHVFARWRLQDLPGLTRFDLRVDAEPHWRVVADEWEFAMRAAAALERTLIAFGDTPMNVRLDVDYRLRTDPWGEAIEHEFGARLGLLWAPQLK